MQGLQKETGADVTQTVETIEMYEVFANTKGKNRTYEITLVTRKPRQIAGFDVAYDKSENRIQKSLTVRSKQNTGSAPVKDTTI